MTDYISKEEAVAKLLELAPYYALGYDPKQVMDMLTNLSPADVVTREAFNRILAENDNMREQLAQIGKKPGDKMDDVRLAVLGRWIEIDDYVLCANCGAAEHSPNKNYCHACGADMRKVVEIDQVKEADDGD